MLYPVRINKYLADKKICSRREADLLIKQGKVTINGKKAELGEMVREADKVAVEGDLKKLVYLAFNKPEGIITHSPQGDEVSIGDILKFNQEVFPLGRIDKDSRGLIILTNDGRMTDRLLNPLNVHEKEYEVKLALPISENFLKQMERGVRLDGGYTTQKCKLKKLDDNSFSIILTEGKKRQIRRMCTSLGYEIVDLKRVRVMNIELGNLKEGSYRIIFGVEREKFLAGLGL
ncbi:pseudouridine synthase [Patescibacteria group bacterium]|nr:pseudouridine synthase [Patescibacteria group bacterium]MBU4141872.1 pseudouridine synthase [Patescibacteria group bacterium]